MENIIYRITILDDNAESLSIALMEHLEKRNIIGVDSVEFQSEKRSGGQMGVVDILGAVAVVVRAASDPLTELAKALRDFVKGYRTDIEIKNGDDIVKISSSHPGELEDLVKILIQRHS